MGEAHGEGKHEGAAHGAAHDGACEPADELILRQSQRQRPAAGIVGHEQARDDGGVDAHPQKEGGEDGSQIGGNEGGDKDGADHGQDQGAGGGEALFKGGARAETAADGPVGGTDEGEGQHDIGDDISDGHGGLLLKWDQLAFIRSTTRASLSHST